MNSWQKLILGILAIFNLDVWFAVKFFKWHADYGVFDHDIHFHVGRYHWVVRRSDYTIFNSKFFRTQPPLHRITTEELIDSLANEPPKCQDFYENKPFKINEYVTKNRKLNYIARNNNG